MEKIIFLKVLEFIITDIICGTKTHEIEYLSIDDSHCNYVLCRIHSQCKIIMSKNNLILKRFTTF